MRYQMGDGTILDTKNATQSWEEATRWDGNNHISVPTGSQWKHETLYRSRKGRYYLEFTSNMQGFSPRAEWIDNHRATAWLLLNEHELPEELAELEQEVSE